jgi:type IV pilus assembly protein PilW
LGLQDIRRYGEEAEPNPVGLDPNGWPALTLNFDLDADGLVDQVTYLLYDIDNNGIFDLARSNGACFELLAESIEAIGFAYAFDADSDDAVDLYNNDIIWAVDSDNDNDLDLVLDRNLDGVIDGKDVGGLALGGAPFNLADVPVDRIRMVRVWLLCRSFRTARKAIVDQNTYKVGDQIVGPFNDTFRRRMLEMSIRIRNL